MTIKFYCTSFFWLFYTLIYVVIHTYLLILLYSILYNVLCHCRYIYVLLQYVCILIESYRNISIEGLCILRGYAGILIGPLLTGLTDPCYINDAISSPLKPLVPCEQDKHQQYHLLRAILLPCIYMHSHYKHASLQNSDHVQNVNPLPLLF